MLPPFIIEQIRRHEEDQARHVERRPALEIPKAPAPTRSEDAEDEEEDADRGVLIIDLG